MKNHTQTGLKAVAALLLGGMLAFSPLQKAWAASATYTVDAEKVNIRKSPSTDAGILKTIRKGEEVTLISSSLDGWLQISYGSTIGYVSAAYVSLSSFSGSMVATVFGADKLNIRAEASSGGKVLKTAPRGTVLTVDRLEDGWFHVQYNGIEGYASAEYLMLSVSTSVTEAPAPQPTPAPSAPAATDPTTLKAGDKGDAVTALQQKLISLGYLTGKADGDFGSATEAAVRAFQQASGLTADGQAGKKTLEALETACSPAPPQATPDPAAVLKKGDKSDAVRALQESLIALGYLSGSADGDFGSATEAAVLAFQKASGLKQDGQAGSTTLQALAQAAAALQNSTLRTGSSGDAVKSLQQNLITLGYLSGSADGEYGSKTATAVKAFQQANGLSATGEADLSTQNALSAAVHAQSGAQSSVLQKGDSGPEVTALQRQLSTLGYLTGVVDGEFGTATRTAVKAFQQDHGLTADGIAGRETLDAIAAAVLQATTGDDPTDPTVLKKGSTGDAVKALQQKLITLGYLSGSADGIFGTATISAVKAFQTVSGLPADGIAGSKTLSALDAAVNKSSSSEVLQKGDSGDAVKALQQQLITLGYLSGSADGVYGDSTKNAVKAFQSANGLSADGIAGQKTQQKLLEEIAKKAGSDASSDQPASVLKRGSVGSAVKALQNRLIELGYLPSGNADGEFGTLTERAVIAFQSANGLSADGIVSTKTLEKLNSDSAVKADAPIVTTSALASKIIATAKQYLGCPYIYGTRGPNTFDCSGLTYYVFKQYGYTLKGSAYLQGYNDAYPKITSMSALQPGDLVFFNTIADNDLSDHTGIYIGGGDFIHASSGGGHVMISSMLKGYYYTNFSWGRRVLS